MPRRRSRRACPALAKGVRRLANASAIEWTEATWNPTTGCSKVSSGCRNCYAERLSNRLMAMGQEKYRNNFGYTEHEGEVDLPLRWRRPRRIFVNSMSDLFHEESDYAFVGRCFHTMLQARHHTYQVLTKRPARMAEFSGMFEAHYGFPVPPHIWMGTSVEDNRAVPRIAELRGVRCATRFVSFEPLLERIRRVSLRGIDWAIIGGESGPRCRDMDPKWVDSSYGSAEGTSSPCSSSSGAGAPRRRTGGRSTARSSPSTPPSRTATSATGGLCCQAPLARAGWDK